MLPTTSGTSYYYVPVLYNVLPIKLLPNARKKKKKKSLVLVVSRMAYIYTRTPTHLLGGGITSVPIHMYLYTHLQWPNQIA